MTKNMMDQAPPATFVGAMDANASIIDSDALLSADIDPTVLIPYSHLSECWGKGEPIPPAWDYCRTSWIIFC